MDRVWTKILIAGVLFSVAVLLISFGSSSVIGHNCQLEQIEVVIDHAFSVKVA